MHSIAPKMGTRPFSTILAAQLDIDPSDMLALHKAYLDLLRLFDDVIAESNCISDETKRDLLLQPVHELKNRFINQTIFTTANSFNVAEPILSRLKYAVEYIIDSPEQPVASDTLLELRQNAESMITQVLESDLPRYLKERLVEILEKFRFAIITYSLHGISGLRKATEDMLGALVFNMNELKQTAQNSEVSKKTMRNLWGFIEKANKVTEFVTKLKELAEPIVKHLLPGENYPPA